MFAYIFPLSAPLASWPQSRSSRRVCSAARDGSAWLVAAVVSRAAVAVVLSTATLRDVDALALEGFNDYDVEVQTFAGAREFSQWAEDRHLRRPAS